MDENHRLCRKWEEALRLSYFVYLDPLMDNRRKTIKPGEKSVDLAKCIHINKDKMYF